MAVFASGFIVYDYLIAGAGLFGATLAYHLRPHKVLVVESKPWVGGNCRTEVQHGITVHLYGPHVFHTGSQALWKWINSIAPFRPFNLVVKACANGKMYTMPFSLQTLYEFYGVTTPDEAREKLRLVCVPCDDARNMEELAMATVGPDIYEALIRQYTIKQWGREPRDLPASILRRLFVRMTWDTRYHNDVWEGVPQRGYTDLIERLLEGATVLVATPFDLSMRSLAKRVIYTGPVDQLYCCRVGSLEYRGLRFEHRVMDIVQHQGCAVMNHCGKELYTRTTEHKHFLKERWDQPKTVVTWEYPDDDADPAYPVDTLANRDRHGVYVDMAKRDGIVLGGRLGTYMYVDMNSVVTMARQMAKGLLHESR